MLMYLIYTDEKQTFVNHSDGLTLQYGNPANSNATNARISTIREHYFAMQNITVDGYLPTVACPHVSVPAEIYEIYIC